MIVLNSDPFFEECNVEQNNINQNRIAGRSRVLVSGMLASHTCDSRGLTLRSKLDWVRSVVSFDAHASDVSPMDTDVPVLATFDTNKAKGKAEFKAGYKPLYAGRRTSITKDSTSLKCKVYITPKVRFG